MTELRPTHPTSRQREHSAQIDGGRLRDLETRFKDGKLNVLSCSTTMEMGVDIGGLSAVIMNNTPPSSANYLQRAGRAGRRGEGVSFAVTLCPSSPHGEQVFENPLWPFTSTIGAPKVGLDSERLVQRTCERALPWHVPRHVRCQTTQDTLVLRE